MTKYIIDPEEAQLKLLQSAETVDEGLLIMEMLNEIKRLTDLTKKPLICPKCQKEITPVNYKGYYDKFPCYVCECESFDFECEEMKGAYA